MAKPKNTKKSMKGQLMSSQDSTYKNEVVLTFDNESLIEYRKEYFKVHNKARKFPFKDPIPPSLNRFLIMKRPQQNAIKQQWKEYTMFVAKDYSGLGIKECELELEFTFKDKRRRDLDNYCCMSAKLLQDGITAEDGNGMITDDSYFVIKRISGTAQYEKGVSKLSIKIKY